MNLSQQAVRNYSKGTSVPPLPADVVISAPFQPISRANTNPSLLNYAIVVWFYCKNYKFWRVKIKG